MLGNCGKYSLKMFDFDFRSLLEGGANTLNNVVTMDAELHDMWDDLAFWFEEVNGQGVFLTCLLIFHGGHYSSPTCTTS
jgi:hypothetical protein